MAIIRKYYGIDPAELTRVQYIGYLHAIKDVEEAFTPQARIGSRSRRLER